MAVSRVFVVVVVVSRCEGDRGGDDQEGDQKNRLSRRHDRPCTLTVRVLFLVDGATVQKKGSEPKMG